MSKKLPQGWKAVKLGDIFTITSGGTPSRKNSKYYEDGNIPWVKTGDLKQKYIDYSSEYITEEAVKNSSAKYFPKDTVLIAMYGATIGATSILRIGATTNQACAAFLPNNIVLPEYLYYYFRRNKENIINLGVGGAQPNISITILKNIIIDIPPIDEQKRIISILEKSESAIEKRDESLKMIDELVKSRFIEMFGTIKTTRYPICKMHDIANIKHGYAFKGEYFSEVDNGVVIVTPGNFRIGGGFQEEKCKFFTSEYSDEYVLKAGDLIVTMTDLSKKVDTLGYGAIVPETNRTYLHNQRIGLFEKISNNLNSVYLCYFMQSIEYRGNIVATSTGSTVHHTSPSKILDSDVILPPIELQNEFAYFVKQVDKLKFEMETSLKELENNFNALMQKAFKGELFQ